MAYMELMYDREINTYYIAIDGEEVTEEVEEGVEIDVPIKGNTYHQIMSQVVKELRDRGWEITFGKAPARKPNETGVLIPLRRVKR